jgi:hypothetical protein
LKMKKISVLLWLGLMIIVTCSFLGTRAEAEVPILSVGDQWSYGWFDGEFTNATGEVGGQVMNVTVDRMEDFEGIPCYVCVYEHRADEHVNQTKTVWMTSDWIILKTELYEVYPWAETRITFVWNPGMKLYDFPLSVGKEWSDRSYRTIDQTWWEAGNEETLTGEVDYIDWGRKVVAVETITVPAGTFETYVIEGLGSDPLMVGMDKRYYFSPEAKIDIISRHPGEGGGGEVLTSYELAPKGNEQGSDFSELLLPIGLTASIGLLGFTFFLLRRRQKEPWDT